MNYFLFILILFKFIYINSIVGFDLREERNITKTYNFNPLIYSFADNEYTFSQGGQTYREQIKSSLFQKKCEEEQQPQPETDKSVNLSDSIKNPNNQEALKTLKKIIVPKNNNLNESNSNLYQPFSGEYPYDGGIYGVPLTFMVEILNKKNTKSFYGGSFSCVLPKEKCCLICCCFSNWWHQRREKALLENLKGALKNGSIEVLTLENVSPDFTTPLFCCLQKGLEGKTSLEILDLSGLSVNKNTLLSLNKIIGSLPNLHTLILDFLVFPEQENSPSLEFIKALKIQKTLKTLFFRQNSISLSDYAELKKTFKNFRQTLKHICCQDTEEIGQQDQNIDICVGKKCLYKEKN